MTGYEAFWADIGWWWIFPMAMIVLCVFMMRGRMGCMKGWSAYRRLTSAHAISPSDSPREINQEEYEEKRRNIDQTDR